MSESYEPKVILCSHCHKPVLGQLAFAYDDKELVLYLHPTCLDEKEMQYETVYESPKDWINTPTNRLDVH